MNRSNRNLKESSTCGFLSHVIMKRTLKRTAFQKEVGSYPKYFESEINIGRFLSLNTLFRIIFNRIKSLQV